MVFQSCLCFYKSIFFLQNRKRQFELVKLERDFNNQKNVLQRKTEEVAASNRRLKEALMKQRITAEKRSQMQSKMLDSANSRMKVQFLL